MSADWKEERDHRGLDRKQGIERLRRQVEELAIDLGITNAEVIAELRGSSVPADAIATMHSPGGDGELVAAAREFLESVEALLDWMNGNDLSADHADAKPEAFERLCNAQEAFTAALSKAKAENAAEKKCACGAMSEQDCNDLPSLRHCGGAEATSAPDALAFLDAQADKWAAEVNLPQMVAAILSLPDRPQRIEAEALARQAFIEGAYRAATALRTPHGLPGEEELRRVIGEELECAPISDCDDCQYGEKGCCRNIARAILSRLTASREDGKNG